MNRPTIRALLIVVCCFAGLGLGSARAAGFLLPVEPGLPPLALARHDVTVEIANQAARTKVSQTFHNPHPRPLEAHFLFPKPPGAQITDFALYIDGRPVRAETLEKEKAAGIYEDIVRRMRDPGLLEFLDRDTFRVRIFPVPAQSDQKIELEFTQILPFDGGLATYIYPMRKQAAFRQAGERELLRFSFSIRSGTPIKSVYSPSHEIEISRKSDKQVEGTLARSSRSSGRDVTLVYGVSADDIGLNALAYRADPDAPGCFMALIAPKVEMEEAEAAERAYTFVLDTSGSMASDGKMDQARNALKQCLGRLRPKDWFNVIRFSTDVEAFRERMIPADSANRARAGAWIEQLEPRGGTNIGGAVERALGALDERFSIHTIVFLTDGQPTIGPRDPEEILAIIDGKKKHGERLFAFGVGYDVNAPLLDEMAARTRAVSDYVRPEEDIEAVVSRFFDKASMPVMTDLALSFSGGAVFDVYPAELPDLFAGTQLAIFGRYREPKRIQAELSGTVGKDKRSFRYAIDLPKESRRYDFIEPLWANRKVGYLLESIRANGEEPELIEEVVALAKRHNIVTPYTSYLVVEDQELAALPGAIDSPPIRPTPRSAAGPRPSFGESFSGGRIGASDIYEFQREAETGMGPAAGASGSGAADGFAPQIAPTDDAFARTLRRADSLRQSSGQTAVEASKAIRDLKESAIGAEVERSFGEGAIRRASQRDFVKKKNAWIEQTIKVREAVLSIEIMSPAYFEVLRLRPDLKDALALGEEVEIALDARSVLRIGPEGKKELSDADRQLLRASRPASPQ